VEIEDEHNKRIQASLIRSLEMQLERVQSVVADYAKWDDTYDFIRGRNPDFLNSNFRENSDTLENLQIDAFLFLDNYNIPKTVLPANSQLEPTLTLLHNQKKGGFFVYGDSLYTFYNEPITNTDSTVPSYGILQGVSKVDLKLLSINNREISSIVWTTNPDLATQNVVKIGNTGVVLCSQKTANEIHNYFLFEKSSVGKVAGIKTTHPRTLYLHGQQTVYLFLVVVVAMLVLVFGLILLRQKESEGEKSRLEKTVAKRTLALKTTMQELKEAISKLESIAYVDELTNVRTRRSFFEISIPWLRDAKANKKLFCIAMMDLDDFKIINDTYGHGAGDTVLKDFCRSCEEFLDERMLLARFGGEEFVIGFYGFAIKSAESVCEKIQNHIGEKLVTVSSNAKVSYTFSFGIACSDEADDIDGILRLADKRLYEAKERGKNLFRSS